MKNKFISIIVKVVVVLAIILTGVFSVFIYTNAKEGTEKNDKIEEELDHLDSKIINILNSLNNIKLQNYKISVSKIEEAKSETMGGSSKEESNSEGTEGEKDEEQGKEETKVTKMEEELVGGAEGETNWELVKKETEMLYSIWASVVLDLNGLGIESEKIIGFSKSLDDALISIKQKDKTASCLKIAKLYNYIKEFMVKAEIDETKKKTVETKSHIVNSYAYVETEKWDKVIGEVGEAEKKFNEVLNNLDKENEQRKFCINKTYILIEELKNSLSTEDKEIFYLKYKNLLESLHCLV